jgi:phosphoglycolate phosphatase
MGIKSLIFDVDGTLIDPWIGLTRSIAFAFDQLGREYDNNHDMRWFVGPPLSDCFAELLGSNDPAVIQQALSLYRLRFESQGISECTVYPGIATLLGQLCQQYDLFVATARIQRFTDIMLDHFGLDAYFTKAYGLGRMEDSMIKQTLFNTSSMSMG